MGWEWTFGALLSLVVFIAATNVLVDPAGLYRPGRAQPRNLRVRKLALLRKLRSRPCATLVLGSSRMFNMSLIGQARFPQPPLNFAITEARVEDYLASWHLVRAAQDVPPRLVLVGVEHPAFHPTLPPKWDARNSGGYAEALAGIGALRKDDDERWRALLTPWQFHQSLIELQRRWWARRGGHRPKFRWSPDGSATWTDLLEGKRNPRRLRRQLRNFPCTGLGIFSYRRVGEQRLRWFEQLLAECAADGCSVVAYIVPAHPALVQRTWQIGFAPVHEQLVAALEAACARHGAQFADWFDCSGLGLGSDDFRDLMHPTDEGQAVIAAHIAALLAERGSAPVEADAATR